MENLGKNITLSLVFALLLLFVSAARAQFENLDKSTPAQCKLTPTDRDTIQVSTQDEFYQAWETVMTTNPYFGNGFQISFKNDLTLTKTYAEWKNPSVDKKTLVSFVPNVATERTQHQVCLNGRSFSLILTWTQLGTSANSLTQQEWVGLPLFDRAVYRHFKDIQLIRKLPIALVSIPQWHDKLKRERFPQYYSSSLVANEYTGGAVNVQVNTFLGKLKFAMDYSDMVPVGAFGLLFNGKIINSKFNVKVYGAKEGGCIFNKSAATDGTWQKTGKLNPMSNWANGFIRDTEANCEVAGDGRGLLGAAFGENYHAYLQRLKIRGSYNAFQTTQGAVKSQYLISEVENGLLYAWGKNEFCSEVQIYDGLWSQVKEFPKVGTGEVKKLTANDTKDYMLTDARTGSQKLIADTCTGGYKICPKAVTSRTKPSTLAPCVTDIKVYAPN